MAWIANRDESWTRNFTPGPNTVCVSITDPHRTGAKLPDGFADVLRLTFHDYDSLDVMQYSYPENIVLCTEADAGRIAAFARKHRGWNILVHCAAGISRSGAVVETLLHAFPEYEDRGGRKYGWPRSPNPLVVGLLRRALGLNPRPTSSRRERDESLSLCVWPDRDARASDALS